MVQIAYHYLQNEDDAKDAVHEIFLDMAKSTHAIPLETEEETKSYLFICIRNRVCRVFKKNRKIKTVNFEEYYSIASDYNIEDEIVKKDDNEQLLHYIDTLPKIYKDVLSLYFANNNTLKEIASILKMPFKTVETRFRRGRTLLKEKFEDLDI